MSFPARTLRRVVLLAAAVVALGLLPRSAPAAGASGAGRTVRVTRHHITLSLHLPRLSYPRNALVRTTVTVTNRGKRTIYFGEDNALDPDPSVADGHGPLGVALPPNYSSNTFTSDCINFVHGDLPYERIAPGGTYRTHYLVVLSGPWLEGTVTAEIGRLDGTGPQFSFHTPRLHLQLQDEPAPVLSLSADPTPHVEVLSSPPSPDAGPLLVEDWATSSSSTLTQWDGWHPASGTTLTPACAHPSQWHVMAGWLNHPVSEIQYSSTSAGQ